MSEIAVLGSPQFTLGFRLAGVRRIFDATSEDDLERGARAACADRSVSILVLETADLNRLTPRTRADLVASVQPTVVAVGTQEDNTLREKIKQAVGVDLW